MLFVKQEMVDAAAHAVNVRGKVLLGVERLVYPEYGRAVFAVAMLTTNFRYALFLGRVIAFASQDL
jgi:hypothetical protein